MEMSVFSIFASGTYVDHSYLISKCLLAFYFFPYLRCISLLLMHNTPFLMLYILCMLCWGSPCAELIFLMIFLVFAHLCCHSKRLSNVKCASICCICSSSLIASICVLSISSSSSIVSSISCPASAHSLCFSSSISSNCVPCITTLLSVFESASSSESVSSSVSSTRSSNLV